MIWRETENFSASAEALTVADHGHLVALFLQAADDGFLLRGQHVGNGLSPLVRMHSLFLPFSRKSAKFRLRFVL